MAHTLKVCLAVLLLVSAGRTALGEQSQKAEDAATECDRLAASPLDDERKSAGVELDQIDVSRAIPACQDAVNAGYLLAMSHLARALERKGDYAEAHRWWEKAASADDTMGMTDLGARYMAGLGITQDFAKARELWEKAAAKGNTLAMTDLGLLFVGGRGVPQDYAKARDWYEKAAGKDDPLAMIALGHLYRDGHGVTPDLHKAQEWYDNAERASPRVGAAKGINLPIMPDGIEGAFTIRPLASQSYRELLAGGA